jgi:hypothetical protein
LLVMAALLFRRGHAVAPAARCGGQAAGYPVVTDPALSHLGADAFLATLLSRVREILDADTAAVLLLDKPSRSAIGWG